MELISLENLRSVLEEYAEQASEIYKYQVSLGGHNASRKLVDSVKTQVNVNGTEWEVSISLLEYWKYLEGGHQGTKSSPAGAVYPAHRPPAWALEKWINVKPILPRPVTLKSGKTRLPSPKELSYAMAISIERYGIEPYPALQTTIDELNEMYKDKFVFALSEDVGDYIGKVLHSLSEGRMMQNL